jgi:hypothetical protein
VLYGFSRRLLKKEPAAGQLDATKHVGHLQSHVTAFHVFVASCNFSVPFDKMSALPSD